MKKPATDIKKMYQGKEEAEKYLNYVYLGNIQVILIHIVLNVEV